MATSMICTVAYCSIGYQRITTSVGFAGRYKTVIRREFRFGNDPAHAGVIESDARRYLVTTKIFVAGI